MVVAVFVIAWIAVASGLAVVLGRAIRTADRRAPLADHQTDLTVADILSARATEPSH